MKERPIIFSAEMVRALLDGRKTQTRRVIKQELEWKPEYGYDWYYRRKTGQWDQFTSADFLKKCLYGIPGDKLYVGETWRPVFGILTSVEKWNEYGIQYCADGESVVREQAKEVYPTDEFESSKWKPSIHMPRWASRILLEITGIRVERVQDISGEDSLSEGIPYQDFGCMCDICLMQSELCPATEQGLIMEFKRLWNSINEKKGFGWDVNPWVWVIEFKRIQL